MTPAETTQSTPEGDLVPSAAVGLVEGFEGFRHGPYRDAGGLWTIGFGSTHDADRRLVSAATKPVSRDEAEALVVRDLTAAALCVVDNVKVPLTDNQKSALISFIYNVGDKQFESSTMLRKLNAGDYKGAANEFPRWNLCKGRVLPGLVTRRAAEQRLFLT